MEVPQDLVSLINNDVYVFCWK